MMKMLRFALILLLVGFDATAKEIGLQKDATFPINITASIEMFRDSTAALSLEKVTQMPFYKSEKSNFTFPYSDDVFWVRFTLHNANTVQNKFILVWSNVLTEQLDFYIADSPDMRRALHKQQKLITSERDKAFIDQEPTFAFDLAPSKTKTVYIKLTSKRGQFGSLRLHTPAVYAKYRMDDFTGQGFLNGLMFFRLFLVLVLSFFIIKAPLFRFYSLYVIIRTFNYWGYVNIAGPLFTDNPDLAKKIDFLCYNSATLGAGIFILATLRLNKLSEVHQSMVAAISVFTVFVNAVVFFDYQWYWLKAGALALIFSAFYYVLLNLYFIIRKVPSTKYYSILFIFGLSNAFLLYVRLLGWIEFGPIYLLAYYFFWAEFLFFILFLGGIFKNAERNKALTEQQLKFNVEQNNRLTELDSLKTTFFANISHELRTPLTLITGPFEQLAEKYPSDRLIPLIQRNTDRLLTLINQLLDINKLEAGQMKPKMSEDNISKYLKTLTSSFISLAESKQISFQFIQNQNDVMAVFDKDKLDKIITNLLSNAFKFTPGGGEVVVKVEYNSTNPIPALPAGEGTSVTPSQQGRAGVGLWVGVGSVQIEVSDTGLGIEEEQMNKIFDRFYQIDSSQNRNFEGTGIGLALVRELVAVLNGQIAVTSQPNVGTTFSVTIPIGIDTWKAFVVAQEMEVKVPLNDRKIGLFIPENQEQVLVVSPENEPILLIVEDNADIRAYIRGIFEDKYQIIEAANGKEGVAKATAQVPDVIISDLMMPEMNGFEFCQKLKTTQQTSHIPIVMLTAKADVESRIEGFQLGADDYLIKPFNAPELQARVNNLLAKQEKLRQYFAGHSLEPAAESTQINPMEVAFLNKIKSLLEKHLSESTYDIEQLSEEMNTSTTQLRRKLKTLTNQTTVEFVRNFRLEKASELLAHYTVSEVAFRVGFESLSYFAKSFQEKFGVLPSEYATKKFV